MKSLNKQLRVAMAIHAHLLTSSNRKSIIDLPTAHWERCAEIVRSIRRAQDRGWHLAAESLRRDLACYVPTVEGHLASMREQLNSRNSVTFLATVSEIYSDLAALEEEFEQFDFDLKLKRLSIATEPIVLEGIYLGPFTIELSWTRPLPTAPLRYQILAQDPHPCERRSNVTHPHVMDDVLCEGNAQVAIQQALACGRLFDFFVLVAAVLRNYNPESPFVELASWGGSACVDCGGLVNEECSYCCHRCADTLCDECETRCGSCEESYCSGCIERCSACEELFCRICLKPCDGCFKHTCEDCLDENERCSNCHEENSDEESSDGATTLVCAAVQPNGLGQTTLSA